MIGNPVDYDKKFKDDFPKLSFGLDPILKRYLDFVPGKNVLDLGIGYGRNSIPLQNMGFSVTGVDYSHNSIDMCKKICSEINLIQSDIRSFDIQPNKFDLILSRCVLHFLHKDDAFSIMNSMKDNVKENGLVYLNVFSASDFRREKCQALENFEYLEDNVFHNLLDDFYMSFYTKDEILGVFDGFRTLFVSDESFLDVERDVPCFCGVIKYIGMRES